MKKRGQIGRVFSFGLGSRDGVHTVSTILRFLRVLREPNYSAENLQTKFLSS